MPEAAIATPTAVQSTAQPFEETFFGGPVWRMTIDAPNVTATLIDQEVARARAADVRLISCRLDRDDSAGATLEAVGFRVIESLVTFRRAIPQSAAPVPDMVCARPTEADACAAIAADAFRYDRYHADPDISDTIADELKAAWVRNGVNGRADAPLVVRRGGTIAGFNLCMRRGDRAVIDLIAVDKAHQGQGLGRLLVAGALARYAGRATEMDVGTQETNAPSIALYRAMGFTPVSTARTYHWTP